MQRYVTFTLNSNNNKISVKYNSTPFLVALQGAGRHLLVKVGFGKDYLSESQFLKGNSVSPLFC